MKNTENHEIDYVAKFDSIFTTKPLRLFKSIIPFVDPALRKHLIVLIKIMELQYVLSGLSDQLLSSHLNTDCQCNPSLITILNSLCHYCDETEKQTIEQMIQLFQAYEMYQTYQSVTKPGKEADDFTDILQTMLSPEQRDLFHSFMEHT
ncbi:MAG: hypothetical protein GX567_16080 [Clostridia bacterium]|nr:hypothetical protein [Clostridia bacterium]